MSEIQPDMNNPAPELGAKKEVAETEQDTQTQEESAVLRAELDHKMLEDQAAAQQRAIELAAGLKEEGGRKKQVIVKEEPPSPAVEAAGAVTKLAVTSPVFGIGKIGKLVGYGLSAIFRAIENSGYQTLKKYWPFSWILSEPEKTWREQDKEAEKKREEAAKKKEAEAKKAEDEKKRKKKLEKSGLSEEQADALLAAATPEAGNEVGKTEKPAESPKEEKAS